MLRCPFNDMNPCYGSECMMFLKFHETMESFLAQKRDGEVKLGMCSAAYTKDKPSFMSNVFLTKAIECEFEIPDGTFKEVM